MKWLLVFGIAFLMGILTSGDISLAEQKIPEVVVFHGKGKLGAVAFSHKEHEDQGITCQMCHHTGSEMGKCSSCHADAPNIPRTQDAFHLICVGCHKHKQLDVSCESCHKN